MITSATRSRAAVLCFGGWGMQLMLHLAPRLRTLQEQRDALEITGPDLTRITRFATLMPHPILDAKGHAKIRLVQPADRPLEPFYLEKLLAKAEQIVWQADAGAAGRPEWWWATTHAERRAEILLELAESNLQPLEWHSPFSDGNTADRSELNTGHEGFRRATRSQMFRAGLEHGREIARLVETHVIDPVRQDVLMPGDPFVQTTLYVIAPLYEPLTSALIWPTVVRLLNHLGRRHVSQIVGIFATGSYAKDSSRALEDASTCASLAELEVLTGIREDGVSKSVLLSLLTDANDGTSRQHTSLFSWVGQPFFDRIYLVDREKSNQGLAQDSQELAILVANAVESFIVADGGQFVQEQVGIDLRDPRKHPYSLLGAATDYVPLDYVFQAVHQQEEKRLVREFVLRRAGQDGTQPRGNSPRGSGTGDESDRTDTLTQPDPIASESITSLADLGAARSQAVTQLVLRLPDLFADVTPKEISDLRVHPDFVMPPTLAEQIRDLPPREWQTAFEGYLREANRQFNVVVGTEALDEAWGITAAAAQHSSSGGENERLLPATAATMRERLAQVIAAGPDGLTSAQAQIDHWIQDVEHELRALQSGATPGERRMAQARRQLAIREWRSRYESSPVTNPSLSGAFIRPSLIVLAIVAISVAYLIVFDRPWTWTSDGASLAGIVVGAYIASLVGHRRRVSRLQQLRRERALLAQEELTERLQERVRVGLIRVYDHLDHMLRRMARSLAEAVETLQQWSIEQGPPPIPPPGIRISHLCRPHVDQELWERCRTYLRGQLDSQGRHSEDRLQELWGDLPWREKLQMVLNPEDGFPESFAESLIDLVQGTVRQAVAPIGVAMPTRTRAELLRKLAQEYNIEHLLWRRDLHGPRSRHSLLRKLNGRSNSLETMQIQIHRYLELLWGTAKPSANFEVADQMVAYGIPVDFASVPGTPDSDLTRDVLRDFRVAKLNSNNPFAITFVRTLHGFSLGDLESSRRYQAEFDDLSEDERAMIALIDDSRTPVYNAVKKDETTAQHMWM